MSQQCGPPQVARPRKLVSSLRVGADLMSGRSRSRCFGGVERDDRGTKEACCRVVPAASKRESL